MRSKCFSICLVLSAYFLYFHHAIATTTLSGSGSRIDKPKVLRKDERSPLVWSEYGDISAIKINDGVNGCYHIHFITMDPHSLFLPTYLYSEMVFFVNSGNGMLSWIEVEKEDYEVQQLKLKTGDIFALQPQTVFYLRNNLTDYPQDLEIYAVFFNGPVGWLQNQECGRVYTGVRDLVLRFDNNVLKATLNVSEEVVKELREGERQPLIVKEHEHESETNAFMSEVNSGIVRAFLRTQNYNDKKKKGKKQKDRREAYNIFKADRDVRNHFGWSASVNNEQLDGLSNYSVSMVNLTKGSMMGPHWNPTSEEIMIVLNGQGMVQVVCPSVTSEPDCTTLRFQVDEGDMFVVPRYHPMVHMSFSNKSFVFMRFTMTSENNSPQYLAGEDSILQTLDKTLLADSFDVRNMTLMDEVLLGRKESIFLKCKSCAEDEERLMEEEAEREREGGEGRQAADIEGEIASMEQQVMRRRWRKAEEAAARRRKAEAEAKAKAAAESDEEE
ncbi:vicilin-like seed storage protein At2g18540 [Bidens hawaiensis]|uniref:vicilin-like seed storage protein At2g18540 n=1 Tax=Bidens hawaiensis TaxID=980011 RepID=UPI00404A2C7D